MFSYFSLSPWQQGEPAWRRKSWFAGPTHGDRFITARFRVESKPSDTFLLAGLRGRHGLDSYTAKGPGQQTALTVGRPAEFGYALVDMASLLVVVTYLVRPFINFGPLGFR